jgi:hypothetical protein
MSPSSSTSSSTSSSSQQGFSPQQPQAKPAGSPQG